ncbi:MAG: radical SAM protein [Clostridia bacterium]|nr:radical SAM protein [Clostridia bacterium]
MTCNLCPRKCNIDRQHKKGLCNTYDKILAANASLHMWEEPCISGDKGSGTVFFSGCNLKCVYCQNRNISLNNTGKEISVERLAEIFLELQKKGAHNINLVTGTHFADKIACAIGIARNNGLSVPVVYNCSGYESHETLKMLEPFVDIYLPDFKYWDASLSDKYSKAPDYPQVAKQAIDEMVKQKELVFDDDGMMKQGVLVRHLCLPGYVENSKNILKYLHESYGNRIIISIMNQFTPANLEDYPEINRKLTKEEYDLIVAYALSYGIENAYIQEGETASESFIPDFDCRGI